MWSSKISACDCNPDGSVENNCDPNGKCTCKEHIVGNKCNETEPGYYDFPTPKGILYHFHDFDLGMKVFMNDLPNGCFCGSFFQSFSFSW